ncbi:hypothetical protein AVEN_216122-1 [Araneus ventricosus]|uniref:Uncharacterized protein n=1 Tax=Araneus ventricosus TaxID=182803 RepID=A0A4Y2UJB8_ARAVE|nr:hypothetical protein AVEN_216122-1 [Araneus ventricosus]
MDGIGDIIKNWMFFKTERSKPDIYNCTHVVVYKCDASTMFCSCGGKFVITSQQTCFASGLADFALLLRRKLPVKLPHQDCHDKLISSNITLVASMRAIWVHGPASSKFESGSVFNFGGYFSLRAICQHSIFLIFLCFVPPQKEFQPFSLSIVIVESATNFTIFVETLNPSGRDACLAEGILLSHAFSFSHVGTHFLISRPYKTK